MGNLPAVFHVSEVLAEPDKVEVIGIYIDDDHRAGRSREVEGGIQTGSGIDHRRTFFLEMTPSGVAVDVQGLSGADTVSD